ncbi:hypothetical protein ABIB29_003852 [Arthrobacter sp. UYEF36]
MSIEGTFGARESRHPEWDLMYRKGLTVGRISELCGAVPQTVSRHIRGQRARHPDMQADHLGMRPPPKTRPIPASWAGNIDALHKIRTFEGRYPTTSDPDPQRRRLGSWLSVQRRANREGRLSQDKLAALQPLAGWTCNQRVVEHGRRWQKRLQELHAFHQHEGRWPRHRNYQSENEHVIGVWLHGQRQKALGGALAANELQALNEKIPGWNTWKPKQEREPGTAKGMAGYAT